MLTVTTEIEIAAPAHVVWNIMDDLDSYSEWNDVVTSISGQTTLGQTLTARFVPDGKAQNIKPSIQRLVPLRELVWRTSIPILLTADHGFLVTPISDEKCKFINREDFAGLLPKVLWKKIKPTLELAYDKMNIALKRRAEAIYQDGFPGCLHPVIDHDMSPAISDFQGGTLCCRCKNGPVVIQVNSQSVYSYLSGEADHWKPHGALFSFVSMVPTESVKITANEAKLTLIKSSDHLKCYACKTCGVHMFGRIKDKNHAFYGLDYIHTELSDDEGWAPPTFAAYVSGLVELGTKPQWMTDIRTRLTSLRLPPSDALSPELMDKISAHNRSEKEFRTNAFIM